MRCGQVAALPYSGWQIGGTGSEGLWFALFMGTTGSDYYSLHSVEAGISITRNAWQFVRAWHDATTKTLYLTIDTATPASHTHSLTPQAATGAFLLGDWGATTEDVS